MPSNSEHSKLALLVLNEDIRHDILDMLKCNGYSPAVVSYTNGTIQSPKGKCSGIVFLDAEAVRIYGIGIYSKIKLAYRGCKIILLCEQAHRDQVKEAMEFGAYCCILEPYAEWEVLTIVNRILSRT